MKIRPFSTMYDLSMFISIFTVVLFIYKSTCSIPYRSITIYVVKK